MLNMRQAQEQNTIRGKTMKQPCVGHEEKDKRERKEKEQGKTVTQSELSLIFGL